MKHALIAFMMILAFALSGCSGKKAEELFETAQFEELQKNHEHAKELYQEILTRYPKSKYSERAQERLTALQKTK